MFYSPSQRGFFDPAVHGDSVPDDVVAISPQHHANLLAGQASGKVIAPDEHGFPVLVDPPKPSLADAKADALRRVDAFAAAFRSRIAGTADPIEVAGWNNKLALAMAVKAGTAKPHEVAALQVEIDLRGFGETLDQFVAKVAMNAAKFSHAVGLIDGMKRRSQDAVMAAPSLEALEAVLQQMRQQAEAEYQKLIGAK
jgi:hypothetical protein